MGSTDTALLNALRSAAATLWQMGATGAAHKADLAIAAATEPDHDAERLRIEQRVNSHYENVRLAEMIRKSCAPL